MKTYPRYLAAAAILVAAALTSACEPQYSTGNRAGVVIKLSNKGLFCKIWEGELATLSVRRVSHDDGTSTFSNSFRFAAADDGVAKDLQAAMESGEPVVLHYNQWAIAPPCTSDTGYVVTQVELPSRQIHNDRAGGF